MPQILKLSILCHIVSKLKRPHFPFSLSLQNSSMAISLASRLPLGLLASLLLISCRVGANPDKVVSFGYGNGPDGPAHWGSLAGEWKACNSGSKQSPIDIVKDKATHTTTLEPLTRDYVDANATLINNGFNIELRYDEGVGTVLIDGKGYSLQQVHWHTPSEHTVDGGKLPMEMHMVHKTSDGKIAVVAVLYQLGKTDKFVHQLIGSIKALAMEKCSDKEETRIPVGLVENKALKRATRKYYRYVGSLSSPPCTEDVIWTIMGKIREITPGQLAALQAPLSVEYRNNSRPVQPLNSRSVQLYKDTSKNKKDKDDDDKDEEEDDDKEDGSKKDKP